MSRAKILAQLGSTRLTRELVYVNIKINAVRNVFNIPSVKKLKKN